MTHDKLDQFEEDLEEFDELHAIVAELGGDDDDEDYVDFRQKDTVIDHTTGLITVDNGVTFRRYDYEHIVYWYPPRDF